MGQEVPSFDDELADMRAALRERLWLATDGTVVEDGDPRAALLLVAACDAPTVEARRQLAEERAAEYRRVHACECGRFLAAVQGIRGPFWRERERGEGLDPRRRSYWSEWRPPRANSIAVPADFHAAIIDACERWLRHLKCDLDRDEPEALGTHVRELPKLARELLSVVTTVDEDGPYFTRASPEATRTDAHRVAAALLGVGVRSVYRGG